MDSNLILQIGLDVLAILVPALVGWGIALLNKKIDSENIAQVKSQIELKQGIAWDAVNFVEQAYKDLDGAGKFAKAEEWIANELKAIGLSMSAEQVQGFVESAVKIMKDAVKAKV